MPLGSAGAAGGASIVIPELGSFRIGDPCVHDNLALYPVFSDGPARPEIDSLTLAEALEKKLVKIKETGDVNRLTITNRSDRHVFLQAGDIVRGGRQDRMVAHDFVLPPHSGPVPVDAFCVESGRWSRRGLEHAGEFASSANRAPTNRLRLAARDSRSQAKVWKAVAQAQADLARSVAVDVRDGQSPTSMELTLDNDRVRVAIEPHVEALHDCIAGSPEIVGAAVAINGRLQRASIYGWTALFLEAWPKVLTSAAVEAVAARRDTASTEPPSPAAVGDFLWIPERVKGEQRDIFDGVAERRQSYGAVVRFITRDERLGWIHAEVLFRAE
jgi:hypothetical protein